MSQAQREKEQKKKEKQKAAKLQQAKLKKVPISDMEERKWQKLLNQKEVNTLMLPLRKGEKKNEATPW